MQLCYQDILSTFVNQQRKSVSHMQLSQKTLSAVHFYDKKFLIPNTMFKYYIIKTTGGLREIILIFFSSRTWRVLLLLTTLFLKSHLIIKVILYLIHQFRKFFI